MSKVTYRPLSADEAEAFWELTDRLDRETEYMLYEPGERARDIPPVEAFIRGAVSGDFLLAAEADNRLVGYISAQRGRQRRVAHSAYIVAGILAEYRGKGIGTEFFRRLNVWAEESGVTRLELTVICENAPARSLYVKSGFEIEGVRRNSIRKDGKYLDEYYMARIW